MRRLAEEFDGLELLSTARHRLQLEGELGVQLTARKCRIPMLASSSAGLGVQCCPGIVGLLGLLRLVLAGPGVCVQPCAGRGGRANLGCIVFGERIAKSCWYLSASEIPESRGLRAVERAQISAAKTIAGNSATSISPMYRAYARSLLSTAYSVFCIQSGGAWRQFTPGGVEFITF